MSTEIVIMHTLDTSEEWPHHIITIKEPGKEDKKYGPELCRIFPEGKNKDLKRSESERLDFLLEQFALYLENTQDIRPDIEKKTSTQILVALQLKVHAGEDIELPITIWETFSNNPEYFPKPLVGETPPRWKNLREHTSHQ